ncbi:MAG TPA: tetratricopeptide repeat protein [Gemmatimonadaceae bacterium]|nr:tetratricopeptide repeat protein [Gemmatimonadaceae bacterium]
MSDAVTDEPGQSRAQSVAWAAIAVLALLASLTGISNGFALDDVHIIFENQRLHSLSEAWRLFGHTYWPPEEGASLYRPLTAVAFSLEWAIGRGSPLPFHIVNVVLYAAVAVALYRLALLIVSPVAAFVAAALFAVHPLHVEVVANVVGQAELWVGLIVFVSVARYIRARRAGPLRPQEIALQAVLYFAACMFKEHAIILPGLLLVAEVTLLNESGRLRERARQVWPLFVALALAGCLFVFVRTLVVGRVAQAGPNALLFDATFLTRVLTMLRVSMEWVRLLVWPASMSADYSSRRIEAATSFDSTMLPGLLVLVGAAAIAWHLRRSIPAAAFGILWAGATLLIPSNLIVVTGFILAERALFLASAGIAICAGIAVVHFARVMAERGGLARFAPAAVVALLLVAGIGRSSTRNRVWHDNDRLFRQTVLDVPTSYRAHWTLAEHLTNAGQTQEGLEEMLLAVVLGKRNDPGLLSFAADRFRMADQCPRAMGMYRKALDIDPSLPDLRFNASVCLLQLGKLDEARSLAQDGLRSSAADANLLRVIAVADSLANVSKGNNPKS